MRSLLLLPLVAASLAPAQGAEYLNFGGASYHFERDLGHNEFNPGIGYERDWNEDLSWTVGYYHNSLSKPTFYGMLNYYPWRLSSSWRLGAIGGIGTGYRDTDVAPLIAPTLEWRGSALAAQFFVVPSIKPYVDGAVVMQLKWRIR